MRVIPHPVFPSEPGRADDGRTVVCLGVIRPYKGLDDAIAAVKRVDGARLLVAGVPAVVYDVGGLAEPVATYGAGRVAEAGNVEALAAAIGELLGDPGAL